MRLPIVFAALLALTGCATDAYGPYADSNRAPHEWRVVSVTPVPAGTAARVAKDSPDGTAVEFSSRPVDPASLYRPQPNYQHGYQPYYYQPQPYYYSPPVTIGLGFNFGRHWYGGSRHHFGPRGHFGHRGHSGRRGHRR
ncbi:MAG: hypothetical protein V4857_27835 [Pseudomonadota bacterium]